MRYFISIILLCAFLFASAVDARAIAWRTDIDGAIAEARKSGKPVMMDFYADWCGWCKRLDRDTYGDRAVNELAGRFICVKVDAERHQALAGRYGVRGYPTVIFLNYEGSVDEKVVGYRPPDQFLRAMQLVLGKTKKPSGPIADAGKPKSQDGFRLCGIIAGPKIPKAIINDVIVKEGDTIEGAKVVKITKDSVKLSLKGREIVLDMK